MVIIAAMIFITLALVFYSIGVWSEKIQGELKYWHLVFFYLGLATDIIGTVLMLFIPGDGSVFHAVTGALALGLMLIHALWAHYVLVKQDEKMILSFHRFSLIVWLIWLIPYISGAVFSIV